MFVHDAILDENSQVETGKAFSRSYQSSSCDLAPSNRQIPFAISTSLL